MKKYKVLIRTVFEDWVDAWKNDDNTPVTFSTELEAHREIEDMFNEIDYSIKMCYMPDDSSYQRNDYKIVEA
jgi:hypothetical protein